VPEQALVQYTQTLDSALKGAAKIVRDVVLRELSSRDVHTVELVSSDKDPVLDVLDHVVNGIKTGSNLTEQYPEIARLVNNQESRAELINNLLLTHDYDRLVKYVRARQSLEKFMFECANRGDLSPTEGLAFMSMVMSETETIYSRVKSGATKINDVVGMLNKIDYTVQQSEKELLNKFKKTTPQGREIVRRLIHKLNKVVPKK